MSPHTHSCKPRASRWRALAPALLALILLPLASCQRPAPPTVVLYSSVDDHFLRRVAEAFTAETGIRVQLVGDTEATKTTGLVQRLIAERDRPRADVWWSSEALGTVHLAREGLLDPHTPAAEADFPGGWPARFRASDRSWHGLASRARVIAYNTDKLAEADVPRALADLADPKWRGRVGLARPQFGTTRGHLAAIAHEHGPDALRAWLRAMAANGVRLYDGNATIVRAIAHGEIDLGLTDTDDVWAAQRNGWPVAMVFERRDEPAPSDPAALPSRGPLLIPNTIALVRGGPNPDAARRLVDFLLSERLERLLAESDSHNLPLRPALADPFPHNAVPDPWIVDWEAAAQALPETLRIVDEAL